MDTNRGSKLQKFLWKKTTTAFLFTRWLAILCDTAVILILCMFAGAYFLQQVTKLYEELRQQDQYGEGHTMDNILLLLVYLYNFKVRSCWYFPPLVLGTQSQDASRSEKHRKCANISICRLHMIFIWKYLCNRSTGFLFVVFLFFKFEFVSVQPHWFTSLWAHLYLVGMLWFMSLTLT